MSQHHAKAGDYRKTLEDSGAPKVCGYRHRIPDWGPCRGELQSDHVIGLQRAPWQPARSAWLVWACAHHNRKKAEEDRANTRAAKGTRMADTAPRPPRNGGTGKAQQGKDSGSTRAQTRQSKMSDRERRVRLGLGFACIAGTLGWWFHLGDLAARAAPGVAELAIAAACAWGMSYAGRRWVLKRAAARAEALLENAAAIARDLQVPPDTVRIVPRGWRAWRRGVPVRARVCYPGYVDDKPGSEVMAKAEARLQHKIGMRLAFDRRPWSNYVDYAPAPPGAVVARASTDAEIEASVPHEVMAQRKLDEAMLSVTKKSRGDWSGRSVGSDAIGPTAIEIKWPPDFNAAADDARSDLMDTLNMTLPGRWRADRWDGERRLLAAARRPPMPTYVPHPGFAGRSSWHEAPIGVDEHHEVVALDDLSVPHALITGATRRGKTVCQRAWIFAVINAPASTPPQDVPAAVLLDPKEVEFCGFAGMVNVEAVATEDKAMAAAVDQVFLEMRRRYRLKSRNGVPLTAHRPIYLFIDEYQEFVEALFDLWVSKGGRGKEHPSVARVRRIARLGAAARIFLKLGTQRPDAEWFKGILRENTQMRLAFGRLSPQASTMAFGRSDIGRDIPDKVDGKRLRGRGNTAIGDDGQPREFQGYWTPNPDPDEALSVEDQALLAMLIPKPRRDVEPAMPPMEELVAFFADDDEEDMEEDAPAPRRPRPQTTRTQGRPQLTPAPSPRKPQTSTLPTDGLGIHAKQGAPRWVIVDGEAVQVVAVEDDPTDEDYRLLTLRDARGEERQTSFPASDRFELADDPGADD